MNKGAQSSSVSFQDKVTVPNNQISTIRTNNEYSSFVANAECLWDAQDAALHLIGSRPEWNYKLFGSAKQAEDIQKTEKLKECSKERLDAILKHLKPSV